MTKVIRQKMKRVIRQKFIPLGTKDATRVENGRYVFAYTHIMTKQVVYSLQQQMKGSAMLRQIPFVGKKSKPAAIRKDNWVPLVTLCFPTGRQGLDAFKKLRELRKLRELHWKELFTREDAKRLDMPKHQFLPDQRGIARHLMDQKANSVADVAKVLRLQEEAGERQQEKAQTLEAKAAEKAAEDEARDRELARLATPEELELIKEKIKSARAELLELKGLEEQTQETREQRTKLGKRIWNLQIRDRRMRLAVQTYGPNGDGPSPPPPTPEEQAARDAEEDQRAELYRAGKLPLPKHGHRRNLMLGKQPSEFTMEGVHLQWYNFPDNEYAPDWPEAVEHSEMSRVQWRVDSALVRAFPEVFQDVAREHTIEGETEEAPTKNWGERAVAVGFVAPDPRDPPAPSLEEIQERLNQVLAEGSLEGQRQRLRGESPTLLEPARAPAAIKMQQAQPQEMSVWDRLKHRYPRVFGKPVQELQV
ncbi:hypothetical protein P152DRAFT_455018 [Eremomyces bilateralis CBS 781.70]|uniref:Large ribosomal subunit protein mL67 n=1 Tax=Eremomyces bilateralis CBS 781.70 TaxID=1392243 RepID=A0A6G1GB19_9PEZI|nr:uncharacterized protein P152DRAFT_455018 [Eremomyces bilateralis CBS 781.70]KAF1815297.1 hypothetical protein P152DRAFT_455018 [Eremomyces bilateralis CBS 781.70]